MSSSRESRSSYLSPRDIEFQFFTRQTESDYPAWWTHERLTQWFRSLPEDSIWICYICMSALLGIVWVAVGFNGLYFDILDGLYNISYAIHVVAIAYNTFINVESSDITFWTVVGFLLDIMTFSHYVSKQKSFKLICYYLRLYRPFKYLWALNDYNLKGSVPGTTLKYCYIFLVLRVTWALLWLNINELEKQFKAGPRTLVEVESMLSPPQELKVTWLRTDTANKFLSALYIVNKMFIPVGPSVPPDNDIERIACMVVMISGCMVVTGAAVASLSLVISIYMRPEESFRARYRLIMKEMKDSHVSQSLTEKVETFYKMYWHKQRAVSATQLMPTFPPTLPATIYTDIYFEATQKCRILRDLSYQFLSEVSKKMQTVHYIPGDAIIKRCSTKSSTIYITCGDLEMLTAEDDSTAILRMTRGTVLAACAGAAAAGCGPAHLEIRAATFCTAHVLHAADLWRVALKHGRTDDQAEILLASFYEHLERVKRHYNMKTRQEVKYKSSILHFKHNLMALKEAKDSSGNLLLARNDVFLEVAGCYIMRNRADASLTDEADAICLRPTFPCILQPTSSLLEVWHFFVAAIIIIVCISHPYYLVFKKEVPISFRFFDYMVTGIYTLDLIVHLSTGANVEEGVPITFAQTSSQQMQSHWFVLDVLGTLPIFEFIASGHFAGINKILRLPKVFRVLKQLEDQCVYHGNVLRLMSYTLLLLIACYLIAALQQGFMCFQFGYCLVSNFTHSPFWEAKPLDDETVRSRLIFGLYWSISIITFTSHLEAWDPENWSNVLYNMFVLEICIVLRIFMEAVYSATIMVTTALREDYDSCIADVKNFLIRNQVDPILRQRFITYLQLSWYTDKAFTMTSKKKSIFYDLPPHVYEDIVSKQRSGYILCVPFMKFLTKEDLKKISSKAKLFYTSPNEILLNTGDISNEMYVIKQGMCEVLSPDSENVINTLGNRNYFGILECVLRLPAFYTIRAVTHVQVFSISRKHLLAAIARPHIKDAINFAKTQPEYKRLLKHRESFVMYSPPEATPNMERFPLPRKYEQDFAFLHPFDRLGVLSVLRYVFPRFTIRPDGKYLARYERFRGLCAFATALVFPCYCYMVLQWPILYYVAVFLDYSACFDIIQRMLVGYFNERGVLVYHPSSTAAHYFKGAFIVDLCGCLPMPALEGSRHQHSGNRFRVTKTKQLLMMIRLVQLYRLPGALDALGTYIERKDILLVIKAIPLFVVVINVVTAVMVLYSVKFFYTEDDWIIEPVNNPGGSWINLFDKAFRFNLTETPFNIHLGCYFWVVYETTTTGYNIIKPTNFTLMKLLIFGMSVAAMIITYFSVRIISIRANVNKALAEFQEHMKDIIAYMKKESLDEGLQIEVFKYYEYNWDKMGGIDYRHVLKLCQQITLRTDAILHIYGPTFAKCPILSQCDVSLLRLVGRAVDSTYFLRDMRVVECDDVISEMYFVDYGGVDVRQVIADVNTVVKLPRGSIFGNLEGTPTIRCPVTMVATSKVHLLKINSQLFYQIINEFPEVRKLLKELCPANSYYILGSYDSQREHTVRSLSTPVIMTGRKGLIKHLYFKDKYLQFYFIIVSLVCVYLDVYNAGFQDNRTSLIIALYALDAAFYLKILIQYCLPYIVQSENVMKVLMPIRSQYFKGEFRFDLASCIPIELLSFISVQHRWMIFALLRLNRMFRIATVYKCLKRRQERITINLTLSTITSVFIWFTLFVHTTTAVWYFIGVLEDFAEPKSSWIHNDKGGSWCNNLYVCSLYFILTTFIQNGVGDIMPKKHSEVIFVIILQLIATMVFMIYVGEFSNIIQYQSFRSFSFYCKYLELQEFMKNNKVSKNLVALVNKYSLHLWRESRGVQAPHFLKTAPHCLKLRVMSAAYLHHLQRHHIFEDCEPAFLRQLVGCLRLYTYNEGMYVVKESEITDAMYLIHTGRVHEYAEEQGVLPRIYPAGSYFGVGLEHDVPYIHSYKTLMKSQVLTLRLDDWSYLLQHFPISRDIIYKTDSPDGGGRGPGRKTNKARLHPSDFKPRSPHTQSKSPSFAKESMPPPPPSSPPTFPSMPTTFTDPSTAPTPTSDEPPTSSFTPRATSSKEPLTSPSPSPVPLSVDTPPAPTTSSFNPVPQTTSDLTPLYISNTPTPAISYAPTTSNEPLNAPLSPLPPTPPTSDLTPLFISTPSSTPLPPTSDLPSSSSPSPLPLFTPSPPVSPKSSAIHPLTTSDQPSTSLSSPPTTYPSSKPSSPLPLPASLPPPSPLLPSSDLPPPMKNSTSLKPPLPVTEQKKVQSKKVKSKFNPPPGPRLDLKDTIPADIETNRWPLDNRHAAAARMLNDAGPSVQLQEQKSETLSMAQTGNTVSTNQLGKSALSFDQSPKASTDFLDKVAISAKKIANTLNPDEKGPRLDDKNNDDIDVLLIQEEEQATEDLLKQLDKTERLSKEIPEKVIAIVSKESLEDVDREEHMATVELTRMPTKTDVIMSAVSVIQSNVVEENREPNRQQPTDELKQLFSSETSHTHSIEKLRDTNKKYDTKLNIFDNNDKKAIDKIQQKLTLDSDKKITGIDNAKLKLLHDDKKQTTPSDTSQKVLKLADIKSQNKTDNSKLKYLDDAKKETKTDDNIKQKSHDDETLAKDKSQGIIGDQSEAIISLEDDSTFVPDLYKEPKARRDPGASTSKVGRRLVHVRYEDDNKSEDKGKRRWSANQMYRRATKDLTTEQKNYRTLDSDINVDNDSESDVDKSNEAIPSHSMSSISLKDKRKFKKDSP